jgi:hypothetical protein
VALLRTPNDAFDYAKDFVKKMPLEQVQVPILDDINKMLWMAAPWRWTMAVCEPVTIAANIADFSLVSAPADFLYISRAYIWDGETAIELSPEPALPSGTDTKGVPNKIAYVAGSTPKFRIHPVLGSLNSSKTYKLLVWYKKAAPEITSGNYDTAGSLILPDEWFPVYREGVLWKAYQYADDQRAGTVVMGANGQLQYSGQRGTFEAGIQIMRQCEPMLTQFVKLQPEPKKDRG